MPNYKGKRPGTRRIILWHKGARREWVIEGSKADGDAFEAKRRLELRAQLPVAERRVEPRFASLSEEYALHAERHLKASTWRVRTYQLAALIEYFGRMTLSEIAAGKIDAFKRERLSEGVIASSINNELKVFRAVRNWAKELGHEVPDVKFKMLPERGEERARAFSEQELARLWTACRQEAPTLLPILVFLVNTGCRKGEAIAAEWSWMDFDAEMIRIPSNAHWQPKNGKPREVPMADAVKAILAGPRKDARWVFPSFFGGPLKEFPKDLWIRASRTAGLDGGVHQLRHTYASKFLEREPDLDLLAKILGHSHTRMTQIYAHLLPGRLERARNAVNVTPKIETVAPAVGRWKRHRKAS